MHLTDLILHCADVPAQRPFYLDTLGLPPAAAPDGEFAVQAGATRLAFAPAGSGTAPRYHFAFTIPENRFAQALAWVKARTPLLTDDGQEVFHFAAWNAHAFYFADPAGNILECIARHNLPNASDRPFDGASLLSISEIGLPGQTVAAVVAALAAGPGLTVWSGGGERFAAVGDEHGVCIVVPEDHLWLPDDRVPAHIFPATLTIRGAADATHALPGLPYTIHVRGN